jgi:hypothetical protein|tara:strand:- start:116 stop:244 length:129 start_codon:yes stop_codon:yes gene_type:complete
MVSMTWKLLKMLKRTLSFVLSLRSASATIGHSRGLFGGILEA